MKMRGLLVAAIALAVVAGLVYWSEKKKKAEEGKPPADAPPKVLTIAEDQFQQIRMQKAGGGATVVVKGADNVWKITEPKPLAADKDAVSSLVSTLSSLSSDRLIEEKAADLAPYGLNAPGLEVTVGVKGGKSHKLMVGDDTPTGGGVFVRLDGDPRVFTVSSYVKTSLDKTSKDLRDKRLLTFDSDKLTRVELIAKGFPVEFGKNNQNEWQVLKPKPLRADGLQVDELVRKLKDAKMDTSVSDEDAKKAQTAFTAGARVAIANVSDATGTQSLEVRKDKDKNYYAKSSVVEGIYKVTGDLGDGLDKDLDSFRNKKIFDFGWSDPTKVEVRSGGAPVTYQKSGDKWMAGAKQMDSGSVQSLIDKLRDLASIKFLEQGGGDVAVEATVTSNDGKRVEKVAISKQGNNYYAKRENELTVYELDGKVVEELQKAAREVKEYQPPKDEKKKK